MCTDVSVDRQVEYRKLPAVDSLLCLPAIRRLVDELGGEWVTAAVRAEVAAARQAIAAGARAPAVDLWPERVRQRLEQSSACGLRPLINATGVVIHTNLGRAPLSDAALAAVRAVSVGYSNLEYDLADGGRGSRHDHARHLLCELTGAEDAMVVNNNAAAIYLVLSALCAGSEV
ncbi:MAG: L-seryl-tRNA(Sec) selenium transferase, partial [Caldilinea sp.]|nr:L-seryl-tRNA(Sec) selenium transferase [Caldilinea sp.]